MARSRRVGARREVMRRLKEIKESVAGLQDWWKAPGVIYVPPEKRIIDPAGAIREREESEYPENQRRYWNVLQAWAKLLPEVGGGRAPGVLHRAVSPHAGKGEVIPGTECMHEPAQIWEYPARRKEQ